MTRKRTKTSSFGVSKREGHDATRFYQSKLYSAKIPIEIKKSTAFISDNSHDISETLFRPPVLREVLSHYQLSIPDTSVHLCIVSLPVLTAADLTDFSHWRDVLWNLIQAIQQKLIVGGRCILILDNIVSHSVTDYLFYPLHRDITLLMVEEGWLMRGEIIWNHLQFHSFHSLTDLQSNYSHILIFSYQRFTRMKKTQAKLESINTITKENFLRDTKSVWLPSQTLDESEKVNESYNIIEDFSAHTDVLAHLMELYSFQDDVVLLANPRIDSKRMRESLFLLSKVRHRTLFYQYEISK